MNNETAQWTELLNKRMDQIKDLEATVKKQKEVIKVMREALEPVYQEIKNTGCLYVEKDWNPEAHISKPITITIKEARKIIAIAKSYELLGGKSRAH